MSSNSVESGSSNHRRKSTSSTTTTNTILMNSSNSNSNMNNSNNNGGKIDATLKRITQMELQREERRKSMIQKKDARRQEQLKNIAAGNPGDVDFIGMVEEWRRQQHEARAKLMTNTITTNKQQPSQQRTFSSQYSYTTSNICIAVRKRPMSNKELDKLDHDSISCFPPQITVHSAKFKVDGITKYLTHNSFQFDYTYGTDATTEQIYLNTTLPLVDHVVSTQGRATVFCYGQTGSGKTYTMNGIQQILAVDLYGQLVRQPKTQVTLAFFELYGGFIQDLLHDRQRCKLLQDGNGEVNITGLQEVPAPTPQDFLRIVQEGHSFRTTHTTEANDSSSRSHAICQVFLRQDGKLKGKLTLVDLAGSERGSDTKSHSSQRRAESADINTSLLSLKECIRAMGKKNAGHVPYRGSKLTLILKDCFSPDSKTTMIATVSPGAMSADHSLNTLRYADRIKEQRTNTPGPPVGKSSAAAAAALRGKKTPAPQAPPPPSQERLQRIAAASKLVMDQEPDAINALVPQEHYKKPNSIMAFDQSIDDSEEDLQDEDYEDEGDDYSEDKPLLIDSGSSLGEDDGAESQCGEDDNDLSPSEGHESSALGEPSEEDEAEMRQTVQYLFELEEALLNQHMTNIQENADMLTREGKLLQQVRNNPDETAMDDYAIQLAEFLDKKEILIYKLQQKLQEFKQQLAKEQKLAQRVHKLTQY